MENNNRTWLPVLLLVGLFVALILCGLATDVIHFGINNATDFYQQQQPGAKSPGEELGMQYSQLRELSAALDNLACKIDTNEKAMADLQQIYTGEEATWPADAREEARNLRWEHTSLLERYSDVAAEYNVLRGDVRTLADNLGLNVDYVEPAEANSPSAGMCNNFALPEQIPGQ